MKKFVMLTLGLVVCNGLVATAESTESKDDLDSQLQVLQQRYRQLGYFDKNKRIDFKSPKERTFNARKEERALVEQIYKALRSAARLQSCTKNASHVTGVDVWFRTNADVLKSSILLQGEEADLALREKILAFFEAETRERLKNAQKMIIAYEDAYHKKETK